MERVTGGYGGGSGLSGWGSIDSGGHKVGGEGLVPQPPGGS